MSDPSRAAKAAPLLYVAIAAVAALSSSCRDLSGFSTGSGSFQGDIVAACFVRSGIGATMDGGTDAGPVPTRLCLTLDTNHLQDVTPPPGVLSTSDGLFHAARLRTIPQIWQDPLSTLSFGDGRLKNLVYVVNATAPLAAGGTDVFAIVSLMQSGDVEVRLLRGAPEDSPAASGANCGGSNLFAVFQLTRQSTPCSF